MLDFRSSFSLESHTVPTSSLPPVELSDLIALLPWVAEQEATPDRDTPAVVQTLKRLKQARVGALRLRRDEGGGGISLPQLFDFVIELARADSSVAHSLRNHLNVTESFLIDRSRIPVFEDYLSRVAKGQTFGTSATELGKQNVGDLKYDTAVTSTDKGLILNGRKFYSTGNLYADYLYVYAINTDGQPTKVVVPASRQGVDVADDWDGFGQEFTGSGSTT